MPERIGNRKKLKGASQSGLPARRTFGELITIRIIAGNFNQAGFFREYLNSFRSKYSHASRTHSGVLEEREYGKARTVVDRAQKAGKSIVPEYQDRLNGH